MVESSNILKDAELTGNSRYTFKKYTAIIKDFNMKVNHIYLLITKIHIKHIGKINSIFNSTSL